MYVLRTTVPSTNLGKWVAENGKSRARANAAGPEVVLPSFVVLVALQMEEGLRAQSVRRTSAKTKYEDF